MLPANRAAAGAQMARLTAADDEFRLLDGDFCACLGAFEHF
jgi:hypothetical protein